MITITTTLIVMYLAKRKLKAAKAKAEQAAA